MDFRLTTLKNSMIAQVHKNNTVSNNLANANTVGFKKEKTFFKSLTANRDVPTIEAKNVRQFSQGEMKNTGGNFDFAIAGRGFFTVEGENGEKYTRNGDFTLDSQGYLRTKDGEYVLGDGGRINLTLNGEQPGEISVNRRGEIYADGQLINKFEVSSFTPDTTMKKVAGNYFVPEDGETPESLLEPTVIQGKLEGSNVDPVQEMVKLMELKRDFGSAQKVAQTLDNTMSKANEIGKVR